MSENAIDGFYTPSPTDVPRNSRWPWVVVAAGVAIIVAGGVTLSGGAHHAAAVSRPGSGSSAQR